MKIIDISCIGNDNYVIVVSRRCGLFSRQVKFHKIMRRGANSCFDMLTYEDIKDKRLLNIIENAVYAKKTISKPFVKPLEDHMHSLYDKFMKEASKHKNNSLLTALGNSPAVIPRASGLAAPYGRGMADMMGMSPKDVFKTLMSRT